MRTVRGSVGWRGSGLPILANGGSYYVNGTACGCDRMALYCPTGIGAKYTVKWMD